MGKKPSLSSSGSGLKAVMDRLKHAAELEVRVGVLGTGGNRGDGLTNAELMVIHEFGAGHVPERAPLRTTFDAKEKEWFALSRKLLSALIADKVTAEQALGLLGAQAVADIQAQIREGLPPPNAPSTIARKGSSVPLIDTAQLIRALSWAVARR